MNELFYKKKISLIILYATKYEHDKSREFQREIMELPVQQ